MRFRVKDRTGPPPRGEVKGERKRRKHILSAYSVPGTVLYTVPFDPHGDHMK